MELSQQVDIENRYILGSTDVRLSMLSTEISGSVRNAHSESSSTKGSLPIDAERINDNDFVEVNKDFKADYIGKFPWINDKATYAEYLLHERAFFDIYQCAVPSTFLVMSLLTHSNLYNIKTNNDYFIFAYCCSFFGSILFSFFLFMNCSKNVVWSSDNYLSQVARRIQLSWFGQNIENILTVSGTLGTGFILYGRVVNGQCSSMSLWESQVGYQINSLLLYFE
jgi:hypothetical protein